MQLSADKQQKELKSHGNYEFPVLVSEEVLALYERHSFRWHWHPEIELTYVREGDILYQINEQVYQLHAGEGLFCNTNALHTGRKLHAENCLYTSITFHPRIIYGYEGSCLQKNYVNPLLTQPALDSLFLSMDVTWQKEIIDSMQQIHKLYRDHETTYEFQIQQHLSSIWLSLYEHAFCPLKQNPHLSHTSKDMERLREILSYLEENYMEHITLEHIASHVGLCREECCRFFKKHMHQPLFDYLMYLRIEKSLPLLSQKNLSITEIAQQTGFSNSSYYSRVFREQLHCSPTQYQKRMK